MTTPDCQQVDPRPVDGAGQTQNDTGGQQPGAECGARRPRPGPGPRQQTSQSGARPLAVSHQTVQGQGGEEADEYVQQPDARLGRGHAVDRQKQAGQAGQQRRTSQAHCQARQQQNRRDPGNGRHDAPAEGRLRPEDLHAGADEPLAQLRVDDVGGLGGHPGEVSGGEGRVGVLRPVRLVAQVPQGVGVLDVVDLVEHERLGVAQPDEAQQCGDDTDDAGDDPTMDPHGARHAPVQRAEPECGAQLVLSAFPAVGLPDGGFGGAVGTGGGLGRCGIRCLSPRRGRFLFRVRAGGTVAGLLVGLFRRQRARSCHPPSVCGRVIETAETYCVL